jgi:two-component system, NtrC family, nitrogen regulation sensor histidine kinase GlnL
MSIPQERAQHLIEHIYTAVLVFDGGLCLTHINTAGENLLSLSQRKINGQHISNILPGASKFAETIKRSMASKQPYMEWGMDLRLPNTRSVIVDCMMTPWLIDDICEEVIVELVDAQSYAKVLREENLSILHDAARKSLQGMAHEIKNPLGGLRGAAQLLEQELQGNELTEYTQIIINEADRLRNLVDRMITPRGKQYLSEVNIHEVLEYVINLVEAEVPQELDIVRDYDPSLPVINVDREQLIQALLNIIRNAVQAINEDGQISLRSRITRRTTIRQHYYKIAVQIEIIDDGLGVPEEIEDGIFYPMVTGRAEGSGLGLSIAQSLIQSHGGMIDYERVDDLTAFKILLPIQQRND